MTHTINILVHPFWNINVDIYKDPHTGLIGEWVSHLACQDDNRVTNHIIFAETVYDRKEILMVFRLLQKAIGRINKGLPNPVTAQSIIPQVIEYFAKNTPSFRLTKTYHRFSFNPRQKRFRSRKTFRRRNNTLVKALGKLVDAGVPLRMNDRTRIDPYPELKQQLLDLLSENEIPYQEHKGNHLLAARIIGQQITDITEPNKMIINLFGEQLNQCVFSVGKVLNDVIPDKTDIEISVIPKLSVYFDECSTDKEHPLYSFIDKCYHVVRS